MRKHIIAFVVLVGAAYAAIAHEGANRADSVREIGESRIERMEQLYK